MTIRYCLMLATAQQVQNFMSISEKPCLLEAGHELLLQIKPNPWQNRPVRSVALSQEWKLPGSIIS